MTPPRQAFVGFGANVGDRQATLARAVEMLASSDGVLRLERSSIYETAPVGIVDQPDFLNLVVGIETTLAPEQLLDLLLSIEREFGRVRTVRWGPRTLDLDLLAYEGESRNTEALTLPHPRMFERAFVIIPLRELLAKDRFCRPEWGALRARASGPVPDESGVWPLQTDGPGSGQ